MFIVKEDIINKDYTALIGAFDRFQVNPELIFSLKGKVDIVIDGYNEDKRELYEIPETKEWIREFFKNVLDFPYFIAMSNDAKFLKVIMYCHTNNDKSIPGKIYFETTTEEYKFFMHHFFQGLNQFTDKYNLSEAINKEISYNFMEYITEGVITGEMIEKSLKEKYG